MFAKLLKHEFKSVSKPMTLVSVAALIAGLLGGLFFKLLYDESLMEQTETLVATCALLLGGIILALVAYGIGTVILLLYRFYKSKFSDEGYLTFTTPASTHQILLASIVNILIWVGICWIVLSAAFAFIFSPLLNDAQSLNPFAELNEMLYYLDIATEDVLFSLFSFVSSLIYGLILPLLSITIGSLVAKKHKLLCAFAVGYGISMVVSTLSGFVNASVYLDQMTSVIESTSQVLQTALLLPAIVQFAIGIIGYFLMHYLIDKKLNI